MTTLYKIRFEKIFENLKEEEVDFLLDIAWQPGIGNYYLDSETLEDSIKGIPEGAGIRSGFLEKLASVSSKDGGFDFNLE